jgi:hypothetical protein
MNRKALAHVRYRDMEVEILRRYELFPESLLAFSRLSASCVA